MAAAGNMWKVVGGASKGGIIVRAGRDVKSEEEPERLATDALVREVEYDEAAQRMYFEKVSGKGPEAGWVSTAVKGKEMLVCLSKGELAEEDTTALALALYCERFGHGSGKEGGKQAWNRKSFMWMKDGQECPMPPGEEARASLRRDLNVAVDTQRASKTFAAQAGVPLCSHCQLPVGLAYKSKDGKHLHGECLAQELLKELQEKEEALLQEEALQKKERREEYDIGWKVEHIPRNAITATKLKACSIDKGMCCLLFDEETGMVGVAPTIEPAAAVNLEYLALALQVRLRDGREPLFSLDPVDPANPTDSMQVKRFEPAWLAGTSVGEVLFQADYHLKELSMGEYEQPVIGMNSIHDYSDGDEQDKWKAREWFIVKKAEVQMTDDAVLMPFVKMGVEAREQILGPRGLEDVKTTRPNHPLVKYADAFTQNFDLIAERKSVVYHLRELAKASVLAKFLFEADAVMDDSWFKAVGETREACCLDIPQLWNERCESQICVQDGQIVNGDAGFGTSMHRLYGGVQFGLDKFQLSGGRQPARMMSAGLAARQFVQPARHLSATLSAGLATRQFQRSFGPMGVQPSRVAGVDLNLGEFNLSAPTRVEASAQITKGVDISGAFWQALGDEANPALSQDDRSLLKSVFNPSLSDRRDEGDLFMPPDTSLSYVQSLRTLILKEDGVRKERNQDFCKASFDMESPGILFPSSWRSSVKVSREAAAGPKGRVLQPRPDYKVQAGLVEPALQDASPIFDKSTEDCTRFRIYRLGSLEVRTVQELGAEEATVAVFSLRSAAEERPARPVGAEERVVKATEYVEASLHSPRRYTVLETEFKNFMVVEATPQGVKWEENPKDLEDRNSLAKVFNTGECSKGRKTVATARRLQRNVYEQLVEQK